MKQKKRGARERGSVRYIGLRERERRSKGERKGEREREREVARLFFSVVFALSPSLASS